MGESIRILHVDDDPPFCDLTREFLTREDPRFEITAEHSAADALDRIHTEREPLDCILSDYQMPGTDGLEFLQMLRQQFPDLSVPFILLTGEGSEDVAADALNAGASSYVQKGSHEVYTYVARRIHHDIEAMRARRDSQRFDTLVSAINDPVYVLDETGRFTYVNSAFCELTGYDRLTILGSEPSVVKSDRGVARGETQLGRLLSDAGPDSVTFEIEIEPQDGAPIPCEDHMGVLPYEGEQFRGSLGILRDISDRKAREQQLAEAKDRYQLLVEKNLVGIYIVRETELVYHNNTFADLFGYASEPNLLAGESIVDYVTPIDQDRLAEQLQEIRTTETEVLRQPFVGVRADGETLNIDLLARGIELDGEPAVIGTVVEVGEEDHEYWTLRRERDRLDEFTSIVSHDLRTPLAVAQGQLELATSELSDDAPTALEKVQNAVDRMDTLLADLLTLAKQGQIVAEHEPVELRAIATKTWEHVETADATLAVATDKTIEAASGRLQNLFENLYQNAINHGGAGVTVTVGDLSDGFFIEDNGPGIPEDERDEVFTVGYSTAADGTGFGLSIVNQIVEAHGWIMRVTESPAGGARFEIRRVTTNL